MLPVPRRETCCCWSSLALLPSPNLLPQRTTSQAAWYAFWPTSAYFWFRSRHLEGYRWTQCLLHLQFQYLFRSFQFSRPSFVSLPSWTALWAFSSSMVLLPQQQDHHPNSPTLPHQRLRSTLHRHLGFSFPFSCWMFFARWHNLHHRHHRLLSLSMHHPSLHLLHQTQSCHLERAFSSSSQAVHPRESSLWSHRHLTCSCSYQPCVV
jgi:hypothetical protein